MQLLFKRRITNVYIQVSAVRSYVELNYLGFRKVRSRLYPVYQCSVPLTMFGRYNKVTESSVCILGFPHIDHI